MFRVAFSQQVFQDKRVMANQPAKSLAGSWTAPIKTQIGDQDYEYTIKTKDDQAYGSAVMKLNG